MSEDRLKALSDGALMVLIESVWAVSARRAFDSGYQSGVHARTAAPQPSKRSTLADAEDVYNSAAVLVRDEVARRLDRLREQIHMLRERASPDTGHGKAQRYALNLVLEELQKIDSDGGVRRE